MKRSPDRNTFLINRYIERCEAAGDEPREEYLDLYRNEIQQDLLNEQDPEWRKENLEYDLRSTEWICNKVRDSDAYAQNLYAALCNNDFQKNEVWSILKKQAWSCTWRYAGGIVAHMREQGDYIDWYCSGIPNNTVDCDVDTDVRKFVPEGTITDEIREDLFRLGWVPVTVD